MKERWKDIPGYEGFYQASDLGNIKSLSDRWGREIIKSTNIDRMGYYYTGLSSGKKVKHGEFTSWLQWLFLIIFRVV